MYRRYADMEGTPCVHAVTPSDLTDPNSNRFAKPARPGYRK